MGNTHTSKQLPKTPKTKSKPNHTSPSDSPFEASNEDFDAEDNFFDMMSPPENIQSPCKSCKAPYNSTKHTAVCKRKPEEIKIYCQNCDDMYDIISYQCHIAACSQAYEEETLPCTFCSDQVESNSYHEHIRRCPLNPANESIFCEFCGESFRISVITMHLRVCRQKPAEGRGVDDLMEQAFNMNLKGQEYATTGKCGRTVETAGNSECSICLMKIKVGERVTYLACCHKYHTKCIDNWSQTKKECPVCRIEY